MADDDDDDDDDAGETQCIQSLELEFNWYESVK